MKKAKNWESQETPEKREEKVENKINHCPVCGLNGKIGAFCQTHLDSIKDYNWIMNYVNGLEKYDKKTVHILSFAISDRVSYIINDMEIIDGKLAIEEFLQEKLYERLENGKEIRCSVWMEKLLKEILALQKSRSKIIEIIKEEKVVEVGTGNDHKEQ